MNVTGIIKKSLKKAYRSNLLLHTNIATLISINIFCCRKKLFIYMNAWIVEKNPLKNHYLKNKIFMVTQA